MLQVAHKHKLRLEINVDDEDTDHAEALADHTGQLHNSLLPASFVSVIYSQSSVDVRCMQHSSVDDVPRLKS